MRFPTIADVAAELRRINKQVDPSDDADDDGIDVRLQVYPDGDWAVRWGLSDYDQDHRGYWGSSSVPGGNRRFRSEEVARDLIDQAREQKATGGEDDLDEAPRVQARRSPRRAAEGRASEFKKGDRVMWSNSFLKRGGKIDPKWYVLRKNERGTVDWIQRDGDVIVQWDNEHDTHVHPPDRLAHATDRMLESKVAERELISMTYGRVPPWKEFKKDIRRNNPDNDAPYWAEGEPYTMELVSPHEIELAETFGLEEFETDRQITGRNTKVRGFKDDERPIYEFVEFLADRWDNGDEEAGELASSIMYTLGYEWV